MGASIESLRVSFSYLNKKNSVNEINVVHQYACCSILSDATPISSF